MSECSVTHGQIFTRDIPKNEFQKRCNMTNVHFMQY